VNVRVVYNSTYTTDGRVSRFRTSVRSSNNYTTRTIRNRKRSIIFMRFLIRSRSLRMSIVENTTRMTITHTQYRNVSTRWRTRIFRHASPRRCTLIRVYAKFNENEICLHFLSYYKRQINSFSCPPRFRHEPPSKYIYIYTYIFVRGVPTILIHYIFHFGIPQREKT